LEILIGAIIGMVFAALASAIYWKPRLSSAQQALRSAKERHEAAADSAVELKDTFAALASAALKSNNESFLSLAQENLGKFQLQAKVDLDRRQDAIQKMVSPVDETLKQVDKKIEDLERDRLQAQSSLKQQIESLASETSALSTALRRPIVRGRWGEMQLRRVVEIAGMTAYCDFDEQVSVNTDDGRLRPDLVVNLAGGKEIVVDAKVPMEAYLKASETDDPESRSVQLLDHLRQTKDHVNSLARKAYWDQFESTPQLVVMFIPNDAMFIAALDQDPTLMEWAGQKNVFLASPITLIAVLKAVAVGWREESLAQNAREISTLGKDLYDRLGVFAGHFRSLRNGLDGAVNAYNSAVGSLERRVLVTARQFRDLGVIGDGEEEITAPTLETNTRELTTEEGSRGDRVDRQ